MKNIVKNLDGETLFVLTFVIIAICIFPPYRKTFENLKNKEEEAKTKITERSTYSKMMDDIDNLRAVQKSRYEKPIVDTLITRFGNHPGSTSYDTTYKISFETKYVSKANKLKSVLQKTYAKQ